MFGARLRVAGVRVALRVRGRFDEARFRHRFGPYEERDEGGEPDGRLDVWVEPQAKILVPERAPYPGLRTYATAEGDKMLREGLSLWLGRDGRAEARVRGPEPYPPPPYHEDGGPAETPLRLLVSLLLLRSGRGALMHACGLIDERGAVLFVGVSGAGKTTLARLLPPSGALSDDQVALLSGPTPELASTPFVGVLGRTIAPTQAPLRAIVALDQARRGAVARVPASERSALLLGCLPLYARTASDALQALALIERLRGVPLLRGSVDLAEGVGPWLARIDEAAQKPA